MKDYTYTLVRRQMARRSRECRGIWQKRQAGRLKVVILRGSCWSAEQVAETWLIDSDSVGNDFKRYQQGGIPELLSMADRGGMVG